MMPARIIMELSSFQRDIRVQGGPGNYKTMHEKKKKTKMFNFTKSKK